MFAITNCWKLQNYAVLHWIPSSPALVVFRDIWPCVHPPDSTLENFPKYGECPWRSQPPRRLSPSGRSLTPPPLPLLSFPPPALAPSPLPPAQRLHPVYQEPYREMDIFEKLMLCMLLLRTCLARVRTFAKFANHILGPIWSGHKMIVHRRIWQHVTRNTYIHKSQSTTHATKNKTLATCCARWGNVNFNIQGPNTCCTQPQAWALLNTPTHKINIQMQFRRHANI